MILVIQNKLLHYRRPFYNELAKIDEVVVLHSGQSNRTDCDSYREIVVNAHNFGPFVWQSGILRTIESLKPAAVIAMFDVRWISSLYAMMWSDRKVNWIWWGLDEGKSSFALKIKLAIARRNNPIVFYTSDARERFIRMGLKSDRLFVGNNTFHVPNRRRCYESEVKDCFINVGSLDARKMNEVALLAFRNILRITDRELYFVLIGCGPDRNRLSRLIEEYGLIGKVVLEGDINEPDKLAEYYDRAIASVSYGQAGLAVLQSMAFGVPFITHRNAISGGEKSNIEHGVNGFFCENSGEFESFMLQLATDPKSVRDLGKGAYDYYSRNCTIQNMVSGFSQALKLLKSQ